MQSVLPHRLAQIRSIQLCYNYITVSSLCPNGEQGRSDAPHVHRMQQCAACNLLKWSRLIEHTLTGLRSVEAFIYVGMSMTMPASDAPWIARLLEMQHGPNGLRELKITVLPGPFMADVNPTAIYLATVARFDSLLQHMIKKGAETDKDIQQDIA